MDLQSERPPNLFKDKKPVPQRIRWSSIAHYARHHGINVDELKRYIWRCDDEMIAVAAGGSEPEPEQEPGK